MIMSKAISAEQLERVESGRKGFGDPCVICGEKFNGDKCPHTVAETEVIFQIAAKLTKKQKAEIRAKASSQ